jgi:hypothetical protein
MLGKPTTFNDDSIDQELPDPVNDEDADEHGPMRAHQNDCYIEALIHHAKLNKILERMYSEIYTLRAIPEDDRLECAFRLGAQVESWYENLPLLLRLKEQTLLSVFRRQATMLKFAYYHAQLLAYRPFLMAPYPHWGKKKRIADDCVRDVLEVCRHVSVLFFDLARNLEKRMFSTVWYCHQVGFLAAAIFYLAPHFRERQREFSGAAHRGYESTDKQRLGIADKMTDILAGDTNPYSPAQRFAVILKELRKEVESQMDKESEPPEGLFREPELVTPSEQLLADALRADWEGDLSGGEVWNPQHPMEGAAPGRRRRLW